MRPEPDGGLTAMVVAAPQDPQIPAVADDGSLYPIGKMAAHRQGVLHLAVSIFVTHRGRLLIQRRALSKYHCGGLWANTCCSHPHWRETAADAARRRLTEELGIKGLALEPMGELAYRADVGAGLVEHEHVHLFHGGAPEGLAVDPDPDEVCETRWIGIDELRAELGSDASRFAPWFRIYAERRPDLMG